MLTLVFVFAFTFPCHAKEEVYILEVLVPWVDGVPQVIIQKNRRPGIELQPGIHSIDGRFTWSDLPENLQIPGETALVSLIVSDQKIGFPNLDLSGRLWLKSMKA